MSTYVEQFGNKVIETHTHSKHTMDTISLKLQAERWAAEEAEGDLKFSGDAALARLPISTEQRMQLRNALIEYARRGAGRTVHALKLHGYLTTKH